MAIRIWSSTAPSVRPEERTGPDVCSRRLWRVVQRSSMGLKVPRSGSRQGWAPGDLDADGHLDILVGGGQCRRRASGSGHGLFWFRVMARAGTWCGRAVCRLQGLAIPGTVSVLADLDHRWGARDHYPARGC